MLRARRASADLDRGGSLGLNGRRGRLARRGGGLGAEVDPPHEEEESQTPEDRDGDVSGLMPHRSGRLDAAGIDRLTERIEG